MHYACTIESAVLIIRTWLFHPCKRSKIQETSTGNVKNFFEVFKYYKRSYLNIIIPICTLLVFFSGHLLTGSLANTEEPDVMLHNLAFYEDPHRLLRLKQFSKTDIYFKSRNFDISSKKDR